MPYASLAARLIAEVKPSDKAFQELDKLYKMASPEDKEAIATAAKVLLLKAAVQGVKVSEATLKRLLDDGVIDAQTLGYYIASMIANGHLEYVDVAKHLGVKLPGRLADYLVWTKAAALAGVPVDKGVEAIISALAAKYTGVDVLNKLGKSDLALKIARAVEVERMRKRIATVDEVAEAAKAGIIPEKAAAAYIYNQAVRLAKSKRYTEAAKIVETYAQLLEKGLGKDAVAKLEKAIVMGLASAGRWKEAAELDKRFGWIVPREKLRDLLLAKVSEGKATFQEIREAAKAGIISGDEEKRFAVILALVKTGGDLVEANEVLRRNGYPPLLEGVDEQVYYKMLEEKLLKDAAVQVAFNLEALKAYKLLRELDYELKRFQESRGDPQLQREYAKMIAETTEKLLKLPLKEPLRSEIENLHMVMSALAAGKCPPSPSVAHDVCIAVKNLLEFGWDENAVRTLAAITVGQRDKALFEFIALIGASKQLPEGLEALKELAKRYQFIAKAFEDKKLEEYAKRLEYTYKILKLANELAGDEGAFREALEALQRGDFERFKQLVKKVEEGYKKLFNMIQDATMGLAPQPLIPQDKLAQMLSTVSAMADALEVALKMLPMLEKVYEEYRRARASKDPVEAFRALSRYMAALAEVFKEMASYVSERYANLPFDPGKVAAGLVKAASDLNILATALDVLRDFQKVLKDAVENWSRDIEPKLKQAVVNMVTLWKAMKDREWVVDRRIWEPVVAAYREILEDREKSPLVQLMVMHPSLIDLLRDDVPALAEAAESKLGGKTPLEQLLKAIDKAIDDMKAFWNSVWQNTFRSFMESRNPFDLPKLILAAIGDTGAYLLDFLTIVLRPSALIQLRQLAGSVAAEIGNIVGELVSNPLGGLQRLAGDVVNALSALIRPFTPEELVKHPGEAASMVTLALLGGAVARLGLSTLEKVLGVLQGDPIAAAGLVLEIRGITPAARAAVRDLTEAVIEGRVSKEEIVKLLEKEGWSREAAERIAEKLALTLGRLRKTVIKLEAERVAAALGKELGIEAKELARLLERGLERAGRLTRLKLDVATILERIGAKGLAARLHREVAESLAEAAKLAEKLAAAVEEEEVKRLATTEAYKALTRTEVLSKLSENLKLLRSRLEELAEKAAREYEEMIEAAEKAGTLVKEIEELRRVIEETVGVKLPELEAERLQVATTALRDLVRALEEAKTPEELAARLEAIARRNPPFRDELLEAARALRSGDPEAIAYAIHDLFETLKRYAARGAENVEAYFTKAVIEAVAKATGDAELEALLEKEGARAAADKLRTLLVNHVIKLEEEYERGNVKAALTAIEIYSKLKELAKKLRDPALRRLAERLVREIEPYVKRIETRLWLPPADIVRSLRTAIEDMRSVLSRLGAEEAKLLEDALKELDVGVVGPATLKLIDTLSKMSPSQLEKLENILVAIRGQAPARIRTVIDSALERLRRWKTEVKGILSMLRARNIREAISKMLDALKAAVRAGVRDKSLLEAFRKFKEVLESDRVVYETYRSMFEEIERLAAEATRAERVPVEGNVLLAVAKAEPLLNAPPEVVNAIRKLMEGKVEPIRIGPFEIEQIMRKLDGGKYEIDVVVMIERDELVDLLRRHGVPEDVAEKIANEIFSRTRGELYRVAEIIDASSCRKPGQPCLPVITVSSIDEGLKTILSYVYGIIKECVGGVSTL